MATKLLYLTPVRGSGGGHAPDDISDLAVWLRPDLGLTKDGSDRVSAWENQGSISFSFTESDPAFQPLYLADGGMNFKPCIQFNDDRLVAGTTQILNQSVAHTIIFVLKRDSDAVSYEAVAGLEDNTGAVGTTAAILYRTGSAQWEMLYQNASGWTSYYFSHSPGTTVGHVYEFGYTGSTPGDIASYSARVDNVAQSITTKAAGSFSKTILGNWNNTGTSSSTALFARLFEFIVYAKQLTNDDRTKLISYLNSRYAKSM